VSSRDVPHEIVPLVRALNGLLLRLADSMASQRRFLADVAHGLRTPVTALQLQVQWLRRTTDEGRRAEAVDQLEAGVERARRLVEQLLHVARFGPDTPPPAHDRVDLGDLARSVVAAASIKAEHRGIDLGVTGLPPGTPAPVWGESEQLSVLLNNLVENALRFTPAGGVVDVDVVAQGSRVGWRVIDDGPGIPVAEWPNVFERFYRGEQAVATARDVGGTGLGLAIVQSIAEHHGARVSLHVPAAGRGLEVRVTFERADVAAVPTPTAATPAAGSDGPAA
jgi:two-component system, OmpR family, sensor kinase